jgi:hydroxymethylglutaryl-CoA lyase
MRLIECPRDAWQGLAKVIPTDAKAAYLRLLIESGFRHIDAVSFVSPKYVPQMADSEAVMAQIASLADETKTEIIGIVVNEQGFQRAVETPGVTTIGYPHSLSATFLESNAHTTIERSRALVAEFAARAKSAEGGLVVYLSMAFGNPYGDPWDADRVAEEIAWLAESGVREISLADTVGLASPDEMRQLLQAVFPSPEGVEIGVHLHSRPDGAAEKILAAFEAGCRRFDSALTGLGGCPFAGDTMVGNLPTEIAVKTLKRQGEWTGIAPTALVRALEATNELRRLYAHG